MRTPATEATFRTDSPRRLRWTVPAVAVAIAAATIATLARPRPALSQQQQDPQQDQQPMQQPEAAPPPASFNPPASNAQNSVAPNVVLPEDGWVASTHNPFADRVPRPAKLETGDLVVLELYGLIAPGVPTPFYVRIDADGKLAVPLAGKVDVKDQTTDRAAMSVSRAFSDKRIERNALVNIGLIGRAGELNIADGPLKAGDRVQVTIFDLVGPARRMVSLAMVGDDGQIELPLAGLLKLDGLSEADADRAVSNRLRERNLLPNATVSVLKLPAR